MVKTHIYGGSMLKLIDKIVEISPTNSKRRLTVTKDELQWILMIGHPDYDDLQMTKAANKYYYPRLDFLLKDLLMKKYRASIDDLNLEMSLLTMKRSLEEVKTIGLEIERNVKGLLLYEAS